MARGDPEAGRGDVCRDDLAVGVGTGSRPDHPAPGTTSGPGGSGKRDGRAAGKEATLQTEESPKHGAPIRETSKRGAGRRASTQWLIVKDGCGRLAPMCVDGQGGRALPVFCFRDEAEMFLCLGGLSGDGWRARETSAGELVSVLYGPCADVRCVALDPVPGMLQDGTVGLVEVDRKRFLQGFTDER